jgi:hypothetical protein
MSQRDSFELHNDGDRMGEVCLLYLLCMLFLPVPIASLQALCAAAAPESSGGQMIRS